MGNYNKRSSERCIGISRDNLRLVIGLSTGHCRLRGNESSVDLSANEMFNIELSLLTPSSILKFVKAIGFNRRILLISVLAYST